MPSSSRFSVALGALALGLVHCSSSGAGGSPDGGSDAPEDASPPADATPGDAGPADAPGRDSPAGDASGDGPEDAATCTPVARECADAATADLGCATTWSTAQRPSTWCPKVPYARVITAPRCDGFDIVVLGATDSSSFYYYDLQTGALVGIEGHGNFGPLCIAGQSPDVPLTDCYDAGGVVTVLCEADGSFTD